MRTIAKSRSQKCSSNFSNQEDIDWRPFPTDRVLTSLLCAAVWLSSSYVPVEEEAGYPELLHRLKEIFQRHAKNGSVAFEYETKLYYGRFTAE